LRPSVTTRLPCAAHGRDDERWIVRLRVTPGEPVRMKRGRSTLRRGRDRSRITGIRRRARCSRSARLDHPAYEAQGRPAPRFARARDTSTRRSPAGTSGRSGKPWPMRASEIDTGGRYNSARCASSRTRTPAAAGFRALRAGQPRRSSAARSTHSRTATASRR
jgi:hypothetical protein